MDRDNLLLETVGVEVGGEELYSMGQIKRVKRYIKVWWLMAKNAAIVAVATRYGAVLFLAGKILRFGFFVFLLYRVVGTTENFASYNLDKTIFFFLTFSLVDSMAQCLFRDVYRFRSHIVNGTLDFILIKPIHPLFRSLMGGPDILDFITLFPLVGLLVWFMEKLGLGPAGMVIYILLVVNAVVMAMAFHILVLGFGVITTEVDNAIMIYRDMTSTGRIPVDAYQYPVNVALTWFLPVAVMMSFPVKAALGLLSPWGMLAAFVLGGGLLFAAIKFWNFAIKRYSSASS